MANLSRLIYGCVTLLATTWNSLKPYWTRTLPGTLMLKLCTCVPSDCALDRVKLQPVFCEIEYTTGLKYHSQLNDPL